MIGVLEVRKIFKITMLLAGLLVTANASAYAVVGGVVQDGVGTDAGTYIGYMGNVHLGLPADVRGSGNPNWIGTDQLYAYDYGLDYAYSYDSNSLDHFDSDSTVFVHWYRFTSDVAGFLSAFYEWGTNVTSFSLSFYTNGDNTDTPILTKTFSELHLYDNFTDTFPAGDLLVRIEGAANGANNGYKVQLYPTAVPIPPAALLFISALAAFGVIGRKKVLSA